MQINDDEFLENRTVRQSHSTIFMELFYFQYLEMNEIEIGMNNYLTVSDTPWRFSLENLHSYSESVFRFFLNCSHGLMVFIFHSVYFIWIF